YSAILVATRHAERSCSTLAEGLHGYDEGSGVSCRCEKGSDGSRPGTWRRGGKDCSAIFPTGSRSGGQTARDSQVTVLASHPEPPTVSPPFAKGENKRGRIRGRASSRGGSA